MLKPNVEHDQLDWIQKDVVQKSKSSFNLGSGRFLSLIHTHKQAYTQLLLDISIHTFSLCLLVLNPKHTHLKRSYLRSHYLLVCLFMFFFFFLDFAAGLHSGWLQWSGGLSFRCSRLILKCSVKRNTPHCRPSKTSPLSPPQKCL